MSIHYRLQSGIKNTFFLGAFLLILTLVSSILFFDNQAAAAPGKINYQGRLTDVTGAAKPDGQYNMKFRIYDTLSGGSVIWSEVRETTSRVTVTNGLFNVQLGDVTPIPPSAFASDTRYFEIELPTPGTATCSTAACGTYTEGAMTPRQPVASSAYALTAEDSDTLDGLDSESFASRAAGNDFLGVNSFQTFANFFGDTLVSRDSNAAFKVTTTGNSTLFNVDTSASKVSIGTNGTIAAITTLNNGNVGISNATPGSTLDVAGNVLFKNATNTATAFQVQSSTAATLFIVDTLNSQVEIGSPTADGVGVILILDTKNTSGDPTGVDGAMYYNSNAGKFRCFQAAVWTDCISTVSTDGRTSLVEKDDFISGGTTSNIFTTAAAVIATTQGAASHPGILSLGTGTTATGTGSALTSTVGVLLGGGTVWTYNASIRTPTSLSTATDRYALRGGFIDQALNDGIDGCFIRYIDTGNAGKWQGVCRSNSVESVCDTTVTVAATTYYNLQVGVNSAGTLATFVVNGTQSCTISTNIPLTTLRATGAGVNIQKSVGTTARDLFVDYIAISATGMSR
jgi:hypothetical protein